MIRFYSIHFCKKYILEKMKKKLYNKSFLCKKYSLKYIYINIVKLFFIINIRQYFLII